MSVGVSIDIERHYAISIALLSVGISIDVGRYVIVDGEEENIFCQTFIINSKTFIFLKENAH